MYSTNNNLKKLIYIKKMHPSAMDSTLQDSRIVVPCEKEMIFPVKLPRDMKHPPSPVVNQDKILYLGCKADEKMPLKIRYRFYPMHPGDYTITFPDLFILNIHVI